MRKILLSLFVVLLLASTLFAQRQSGAIQGTVQDADGRAISQATITVSSPSLIGGSYSTFSERNGYYRFPVLASGNYEVKAETQGFQTVIRKNVALSVGKTLTVDLTLEVSGVSETIEVTEKPPLIDVSTTAVSATIPSEIIRNLPKVGKIEQLLALTPGVGDDLIAYGGDGQKANSLWMDGVNMSDPRNGTLNVEYDYNWIDEVQVAGIGAPAEYGGFTGVVGNFITRSGGNQFHGLLETFFQNQNLFSTNTPDQEQTSPFKSYDISAQVGGPILRDKLWFFSGYEYPSTQAHPFGYDGVTTDKYKKFITKLTYKWDENNTLQGLVLANDHDLQGEGAGPNTLPEATTAEKFHQASWNATWLSLWSAQTTFEGRLGGTYDHEIPVEDNPNLPGHEGGDRPRSVNAIQRIDDQRFRLQANAVVSHHAQDFIHGSHDFRFGVEVERSDASRSQRFNGGMYYYDYNSELSYRALSEGYDYDGRNRRVSSYAQDEWNITDDVTISAGVRWDHNRGNTDRGTVFANDPVAPRIGFIWKLDRDGQTVVKAHFGDYYEALLERNYYFLTDHNALTIFQHYAGNGQWVEDSRSLHNSTKSAPNLKEPYVRQFNVGLDRVIGGVPVGVVYIHRRWANILEDIGLNTFEPLPFVNPLTGQTITIYRRIEPDITFLLGNPGDLFRRYDGLEFYVNKQFPHHLSVSASFVYSRMSGNSPGDNGWPSANTPFLDSPNSLINFPGKLYSDRPISWKIVGTCPLPWGFNAGWYFRHTSGNTWAAETFLANLPRPGRPFIFLEPAGSRRLPSRNLLDLRFEKAFPVYKGQLLGTIDIFNVLNASYPMTIDFLVGDKRFGSPTSYNDPREIRLGARYSF